MIRVCLRLEVLSLLFQSFDVDLLDLFVNLLLRVVLVLFEFLQLLNETVLLLFNFFNIFLFHLVQEFLSAEVLSIALLL